jgi:hypothetical protein
MHYGWVYTVLPKIDNLAADMTGVDIGVATPVFSPENFPDGSVGVPYNQTVSLKGGIGPFTINTVMNIFVVCKQASRAPAP